VASFRSPDLGKEALGGGGANEKMLERTGRGRKIALLREKGKRAVLTDDSVWGGKIKSEGTTIQSAARCNCQLGEGRRGSGFANS